MKRKILFLASLLAMMQVHAQSYTDANNVNYSINGTTAYVDASPSATGDITIPDHITVSETDYPVTIIGDLAFNGCTGLTSVVIPNSVTAIKSQAFASSGLTSITIPSSVTSIEISAFSYCEKLASVTISGGEMTIGDEAFNYCEKLSTVNILGSVTSLGTKAFYHCSLLTSFAIPNGLTTISSQTFSYSGLTAITIPYGVTTIEESAFSGCAGLTTVTIPGSVTAIGNYAFYLCSAVNDVYCYAAPSAWNYSTLDFKSGKGTHFHVFDASAWSGSSVRATFDDDLATHTSNIAGNLVDGVYWSTYYSSAGNQQADASTTVYKAEVSGSTLVLTEIADKVINEGQAVILESTAASTTLTPQAAVSATSYTDNALEGVSSPLAKDDAYDYYVLSNGSSGIGFYRYTGATLGANKAFVKQAASPSRDFFGFEDNETTNIENLTPTLSEGEEVWYDLSGRRVESPTKGIYIKNGKKFVVR